MSNIMVYAIHAPDAAKLDVVKAEMLTLGPPTIRVVDCGDYYMALEGSHRLAAAADLDITPDFVVFAQDDMIDVTAHDWYEVANWGGTEYPAGEVAGELYSTQARGYEFAR